MVIRRADKEDYRLIAQLHIEGIKKGFLSSLGIKFLTRLYSAINKEQGACVLVADDNGEIAGFISGATDIRGLYKRILLNAWPYFVMPLFGCVMNIITIKKIVETILYGFKAKKKENHIINSSAELLSIAVNTNYRGRGVGKVLVYELEKFLKHKQVKEYTVVTYSLDDRSNGFYRTCNFSFAQSFSHHGNVMNIYHKKLL